MEEERPDPPPTVAPHVDAVGATLVVVGMLGGLAWISLVISSQLLDDEPGSFTERLDVLAVLTIILLLAVLAVGIGVALRTQGGPDEPTTSPLFRRPVGRIAGAVVSVVAAVGLAVGIQVDDRHDDSAPVDELPPVDLGVLERGLAEPLPPELVPLPDHTLEVHTDGCGVIRSGAIGDDLTWVVKDQDGFQVLGRNAAGETRYRFYQSGTYTVVLETWGGDHYVEVSNEVTITC